MKTIKIDEALLDAIKTDRGGYTKGVAILLGVNYPLAQGWKNKVLGGTITITGPGEAEATLVPAEKPQAATPPMLIEMAVSKGADLDQLEKLMGLQERWEAKEAAKAFREAMAKFQAMKPVIKKGDKASFVSKKTGQKNEYSFASLSKIQQAVDPVLTECGLSYTWKQQQGDGSITVKCILSHVAGHSEENEITAPHDDSGSKNAIQGIGSTVTYLKRYTLEGALGISTDKDDDGGGNKGRTELMPGTDKWLAAIKHLGAGDVTLKEIETKYFISEENREILLEASMSGAEGPQDGDAKLFD